MASYLGRRKFLATLGGAAAWPLAAAAQQSERMRRIGVLLGITENDLETQSRVAAFRKGLRDLGWIEGRNVQIDYRFASGDLNLGKTYAAELVKLAPDVLLANSTPVMTALRQATTTIPIVFAVLNDPVGQGFISSLARPGGNITGFTVAEFSTFGKLLEVLKEVAPHVTRVAVVLNPDQIPQAGMLRAIEAAAPSFRVQVTAAGARDAAELERAIDQFVREPNGGLIVLPNPVTDGNRRLIIAMAVRHRLPAAYAFRHSVAEGGLISYGIDLIDQFRQAASYVDRILRGEKPADLPVQQPTKFDLVINLKTAKALGLDVPWFLQQRADEVIE